MELTYTGNMIEGVFWVVFSLPFWWGLLRKGERRRRFCLFGAVVFVVFGGSDFYEAQTGAWYKPWWLIVWNGACIAGIVVVIVWYIRIYGSVRQAWRALSKRPKD